MARLPSRLDIAAAAYVRGHLRNEGITVQSLSKLTGISLGALRYYVNGTRAMSFGDFMTIVDTLGLDATDTITRVRRIAADLDG